jgi:hypothetical protein
MDQTTSNTVLTIVNPIAQPRELAQGADRFAPASRPSTLDGKTIALYWNGKQNGQHALTRTREHLSRLYQDVTFIDVVGELGGTNRYLSPKQLDMLAEEADVAVCTSAD